MSNSSYHQLVLGWNLIRLYVVWLYYRSTSGYYKALYLTIIPMPLVDNGSTINMCPLRTAENPGFTHSDFYSSSQGARAYDNTLRKAMETLTLLLCTPKTLWCPYFSQATRRPPHSFLGRSFWKFVYVPGHLGIRTRSIQIIFRTNPYVQKRSINIINDICKTRPDHV